MPPISIPTISLSRELRTLSANVVAADERKALSQMLRNDVRRRRNEVNRREREAWAKVRSKDDWEKFVEPRIDALRKSLGIFPPVPRKLNVHVTRTVVGDGYLIENIVYESRRDVLVTANLYLPQPLRNKMPAIVIIHSHHNPKTQGELQDMGMTWARTGCAVLVLDQLSYGERRQHPAWDRQDYRFRYINSIQLHVIGDSLMGWMAWDTMRGIDLLWRRKDVDRNRIVLIGSVAGGGDPAGVVAALDKRVACVIPFNFGGPQPEAQYPLPDDAETSFNYMGSGSWESTRNLRLSGRDGFLPWVIVGSIAPRRLIHAHEFSWDMDRDPVWKRYQRLFAFYDASDRLSFTHGHGLLSGQPPEASHCNNVGVVHRQMIHQELARWFKISIPQEYQQRRPVEDLARLIPTQPMRPLHELYDEIGASRASTFRARLDRIPRERRRKHLRDAWAQLLGDVEPRAEVVVKQVQIDELSSGVRLERLDLEVEPNIVVPTLFLMPTPPSPPLVVAVSQHGNEALLHERADEIAALLLRGVAVCLPDVRGTGETAPDGSRERQSEATSISATELMLGQTLLGARLRDLRAVLRYLRGRRDVDAMRVALWGDSFAPMNSRGFADPLIGVGEQPRQSEPLGGLLTLLGGLFEDNVDSIIARGMIAGYQSVLRDQFCYVPHDAIVPGALTAGDLCDIAAALAPRPLRLEQLVDGRNVLMSEPEARELFAPAIQAYHKNPQRFVLTQSYDDSLAECLVDALQPSQ